MTGAAIGSFKPPAIQVTADGASDNHTPPPVDDSSIANTPEPLSPFSPSSSRHLHHPPWDDEHDDGRISHSADSRAAAHASQHSRDGGEGEETDQVSLTSPVLSPGAAGGRAGGGRWGAHARVVSSLSPSSFSPPTSAGRQHRAASIATVLSPTYASKQTGPPSPPRHHKPPSSSLSYSPRRKEHPSIARVRSHDVKDESPSSASATPPSLAALAQHHSMAAPTALSSPSRLIRISPQSSPKSSGQRGSSRGFPISPHGSKAHTPSHRNSSQMAPELAAHTSTDSAGAEAEKKSEDEKGQGEVAEQVVEVKSGGWSLLRWLYGCLHVAALYILYYVKSCSPFYPNPPYNIDIKAATQQSAVLISSSPGCGPQADHTATISTITHALGTALGFESDFCPKRNLTYEQREEVMRPKYLQANRLMHTYILCELLVSYIIAVHRDMYVKTTVIGAPVVLVAHAILRLFPHSRATRAVMGIIAQGLVIMNCYHSGGIVEMQYGFFVTFTVLIIYEDWYCLLPSCIMVVLDYVIEITLATQGVKTGFIAGIDLYIEPVAIATHVVMLLFQVCLCSLWSHLQRHRTLRDAVQRLRLVEERKQAQKASAAKSDFLSTMSHEIRTPMNGIIGMSELLVECELNAEQHEYAEIIRSSGQSLLSIINDILDFSKIEGHKLVLERIPMNLHRVCEVVCDLLADNAGERHVEFVMRYQPTAPRFIIADPGRIRQICLNLLGNALKFTTSGYVVLNVEVVDAEWEQRRRLQQQLREIGGVAASGQQQQSRHSSPPMSPLSSDDDPLALPGLSDIIDMQPVTRVYTPPVDGVTTAIQQFTRKHLFPSLDSADAVVSAVASGPPPPLFTQTLPPAPQPKRLFSQPSRKKQPIDLSPASGLSRASSQSTATSSTASTTSSSSLVLRISVTDSGIGLSSDNVQHIFDPFTQADSSTSRKYGGSGLGLAICRRLCHLMGGQLSVHSRIGDGSTFCFTLPIELDHEAIEHHTRMLHAMEKAKQVTTDDRRQPSGQFTHSGRALPISNKPASLGAIPNIELLSGCRVLLADSKQLSRAVMLELLGHHGAAVTALPPDSSAASEAGRVDGPAECSAVLSEVLSEWSRCHLDVQSYYHTILLDADGVSMDADRWQSFIATLHTEENRRAVDMVQELSTNTTIVLLVTARQKRRYEEAVSSPRVVYLLKPFRESALIRVLTTPHSMHNTRQYDHPSRTSYRSAMTSTTHQPPAQQLPTFSSDAMRNSGRPILQTNTGSSGTPTNQFSSPVPAERNSVAYSVRQSLMPQASGADNSWYTGDEEPQPDTGDNSHRSRGTTPTLFAPFSPVLPPRRPSAAFPLLPLTAVAHKHSASPSRDHASPHTQPQTQTMPIRRLVHSSRSNSAHSRSVSLVSPNAMHISPHETAVASSGSSGGESPRNGSANGSAGRALLGGSMSSTAAGGTAAFNRSRGPSGGSTSDSGNHGRVTPESHNSDSMSGNGRPPQSGRKSSRHHPAGSNAAAVIAGMHATTSATASQGKAAHPGSVIMRRNSLATTTVASTATSAPAMTLQPPPAAATPTATANVLPAPLANSAAAATAPHTTITMPPPAAPSATTTTTTVLPPAPALLPMPPNRAPRAVSSAAGCRILLVEDTPLNQKVATRILEKLGCHVTLARDGQLAVDYMRAHRDDVELVLMDLNMPVMDGLEATRVIRSDEARDGLVRMPIVAMTADCMPEVEDKCAAVGMDEVTFKPIAAKKVEQVIKHWMRKQRSAVAAAAEEKQQSG